MPIIISGCQSSCSDSSGLLATDSRLAVTNNMLQSTHWFAGEEEPLRGLIACLYEDSDGDKMVQVGGWSVVGRGWVWGTGLQG
jgi:hypothetical protein